MYRLSGPSVDLEIEVREDGKARWYGQIGERHGGSEGWISIERLASMIVRYVRSHERPPAEERHD
jgi:hypothetical protein